MIYVLILPLIIIGVCLFVRHRRHENGKPIIAKRDPSQDRPTNRGEARDEPDSGGAALRPRSGDAACSVLLVDDQPLIRAMLRELFEREGMTVFEAPNGAGAIEAVRQHEVGYILLDLKLPDMSGIEALKEIRLLNDTVQIALMTGFGSPDQLAEAERFGVTTHFLKPFDLQLVKKHVMNSTKKVKYNEGEVS